MNTQNLNKVKELLSKINETSCTNIDLPYYMNEDINSFEELKNYMESQDAFNIDIIYYSTAIEYLANNDSSLIESLKLVSDMGYETKDLNSEILASILASHKERVEFEELESELTELFDEIEKEEKRNSFNDSLILAVDSHFGVYAPQTFIERYGQYLDLSIEDKKIMSNVEHELYYEVWQKIENKGLVIDKVEYSIYYNEDIWIAPSHIECPEDFWI